MNTLISELSQPAVSLILTALGVVVAFLIRSVILNGFQRFVQGRAFWPPDLKVGRHFFPAFWAILMLVMMWFLLPHLDLSKDGEVLLKKAVRFAGTLAVAWNITRILTVIEHLMIHRIVAEGKGNLKNRKIQTQLQFVTKVLTVLVWIVGGALALMTFDPARRVGASLLASAGLASVILGFAAQRSISNLIAGFQIAFTQPIRIDDVVVIEGEGGRIEEITLTYVVVELWDLRRLIVPITYFLEKPFTNWTRSTGEVLGTVLIHVDYQMPIESVRKEFLRLVESSDLWNRKMATLVVFDTTDKTIQLRAMMGADSPVNAFELKYYVREGLIKFLQENSASSFPVVRFSNIEKD